MTLINYQSSQNNDNMLMDSLCNKLFFNIMSRAQTSIFSKDYPIIALFIIHGMKPDDWKELSWEIFLGSVVSVNKKESRCPSWVPDGKENEYISLREFCPKLLSKYETFSDDIEKLCSKDDLGVTLSSIRSLSAVERLIFIKLFNPCLLNEGIHQFCYEEIGYDTKYVSQSSLDILLKQIINERNKIVLFVIEGELDPGQDIEDFANKTLGNNR